MEYSTVHKHRFNVFVFGGLCNERRNLIRDTIGVSDDQSNADKCSASKSENKDSFFHEDVEVQTFCMPSSNDNGRTMFEIWNFSDKKMSQGIAQLFLNQYTIVVVLINDTVVKDQERTTEIWRNFAFKGVQSVILLDTTNNTKDSSEHVLKIFEALDENNNHANQNNDRCTNNMPTKRTYYRQNRTANKTGFSTILKDILSATKETIAIKLTTENQLLHYINVRRNNNEVFCEKKCITTVISTNIDDVEDVETSLGYLVKQGTILRFWERDNENELICINPVLFLKLIYAIYIDSCNKTFRIAPSRFWREEIKQRPDRSSLEKVIEDIPQKGLVRQCLLPLLWQDLLWNKEQIVMVSGKMESLGLMMPCKKMSMFSDVLSLLDYPQLSPVDQLSLILMGKLNDLKPSLNWYEELQTSDVQLQFTVLFSQGVPSGFLERYLAATNYVYKHKNYHYVWKSGLLLRIYDVFIYITIKTSSLEMFVRTDMDIYTNIEPACKELWLTSCLAIDCLFQHTSLWPKLVFQVTVSASGDGFRSCRCLHTYDVMVLLSDCYLKTEKYVEEDIPEKLHQLFPFKEFKGSNERQLLKDWIVYLKSETENAMKNNPREDKLEAGLDKLRPKSENVAQENIMKRKKQKKDITWNVSKSDTQAAEILEVADTSLNNNQKCSDTNTTAGTSIVRSAKSDENINFSEIVVQRVTQQLDNVTQSDNINFERLVSSFVAAIIASGVATYIDEEYERQGKWTAYQASVATEMAEAIMFVNSNDVMAAARTIINTVDKAAGNDVKHTSSCCINGSLCNCGHTNPTTRSHTKLSSVCVLL